MHLNFTYHFMLFTNSFHSWEDRKMLEIKLRSVEDDYPRKLIVISSNYLPVYSHRQIFKKWDKQNYGQSTVLEYHTSAPNDQSDPSC